MWDQRVEGVSGGKVVGKRLMMGQKPQHGIGVK
jgi:hypothetical protein